MHPDAPLRRITIWLALVGYTLVASGLPLPLGGGRPDPVSPAAKRLAGKDRSRPFPCMDKSCGCDSADRCFTNCCCHSPAETLAWAKAHRVDRAVLTALERRVARAASTVAKASGVSCCSGDALAAEPSCCACRTPAAREAPAEEPAVERPLAGSVTLRSMLACGGVMAEWFAAGAALPPPRMDVAVAMPATEACLPADEAAACLRAPPAAPPPRAA